MMRLTTLLVSALSLCALHRHALAASGCESLPPANPLPAPITRVLATYVLDDPRDLSIRLFAEGHTAAGTWCVARARLSLETLRERAPHRIVRAHGRAAGWIACWRIVRGDVVVGCIRKRIQGNNHPDPTRLPDTALAFEVEFDPSCQLFALQHDPARALPRPVPLTRSWSGLRVLIPLPLAHTTSAVAKRALRVRGASIAAAPADADAVLLPDAADFCMFDRRSSPRTAAALVARGARVLYERDLDR